MHMKHLRIEEGSEKDAMIVMKYQCPSRTVITEIVMLFTGKSLSFLVPTTRMLNPHHHRSGVFLLESTYRFVLAP